MAVSTTIWPIGKKAAFGTLAVAMLLGLFDYADRLIISSLFPYLKGAYGITDTQLGMLPGIINIVLAVLVVPCGYLVDRWSRKKMIAVMMLFWAAGSFMSAVASSFAVLLAARSLIGFGESAYTPAMQSMLAASFPQRWRVTAVGMQQLGTVVGCVAGLALGAYIADTWGWRHALGIMCIPGLAAGLSALLLKDICTKGKASSAKGLNWKMTIATLLKNRSLLCVYAAHSLFICYSMALGIWLLTYLNRVAGMDLGQASFYSVLLQVCGAAAMLAAGPLLDWLRSRSRLFAIRFIMGCLSVSFAMSFSAFIFFTPGSLLQITCILGGLAFAIPMVTMDFALNADLAAPQMRGTSTSLLLVIMNFGGAVGPVLLGRLSDILGMGGGLAALSFFILAAGFVYFLLSSFYRNDHLPEE